ncbi:MAG: hypothetical protein AAF289_03005 [Cyanobacteria bacterium P01_A01_bin.135]
MTVRPSLPWLALIGLIAVGCGEPLTSNKAEDSLPDPSSTVAEAPATDSAPTAAAPEPAVDTTIIPGERLGPITRQTSRDQLANLFGEENLEDTQVDVGEGLTESGTNITLANGETISVLWTDASQSDVLEVRQLGPQWQTPEGIHVGMSLEELKSVAGSFEILGFGWDYGGTVLLDNSQVDQYANDLILRLAVDDASAKSQAYQTLIGDTPYPSTDSRFNEMDAYVDEMIVVLTPYGEF